MSLDDLRLVLAFPLVSAIVLAVGPYFSPGVRWSRRLRSELDIISKLPPGAERDEFERGAISLARRVLDYRTRIPLREKVLSWAFVCIAAFLLALLVSNPAQFFGPNPEIPGSPWSTMFMLVGFALTAGFGVFGAFSGRTSRGLTADQHEAYARSDRSRMKPQPSTPEVPKD